MNNFMDILQQFNEFRNSFKGNPQEEVEKLLKSGNITQEQLNNAQAFAKQFMRFLK